MFNRSLYFLLAFLLFGVSIDASPLKFGVAGRMGSTSIGVTVPDYTNAGMPAAGDAGTLRHRNDAGDGYVDGMVFDTGYGNMSLLANAVNVYEFCPSAAAFTAKTCLDDAVSTLGSTNQHTILIPDPQVISANLTITSNLTLVFQGSGRLDPDAATTTTLSSMPVAPPDKKIFGGSGSVVFSTAAKIVKLSVAWWGATGDGTTNDYTAINNAFSAAPANSEVFFPKGNYYISGNTFTITKRLAITGVGNGSQIYQSSATLDLFVIGSAASDLNGFEMRDLTLGSASTTAGKAVIKLIRSHRGYFKNIVMQGGYYGLYLSGGLINTFINLRIDVYANFFGAVSVNQWGVFADTTSMPPNANRFYNLIVEGSVNGFKIDGNGQGGVSIYGGTIEDNTGTGIEILNSITPSVVDGVHCENNTVADMKIDSSHSVNINATFGDGILKIVNSTGVAITNGYHDKIDIDVASKRVSISNLRYNGTGAGYINDFASDTKITALRNSVTSSGANGNNTSHPTMFGRNGGMELWSAGFPIGWSGFNGDTIVQTGAGLGDTTKKFGSYAAKVTGNVATQYTGMQQVLSVGVAGQWIFIDYWVYVSSGSTNITIWIDGGATVYQSRTITTTAQWIRLQESFLLPATFTSASILMAAPSGSVIYFDAIKIWADSPNDIHILDGNYSDTFGMTRHTTANTAGNNFTIQSGGSTLAATDKSPGNLILATGLGTGNATPGLIRLQGTDRSATSGTGDRSLVDRYIPNASKVLTNNSAIAVVNATIANGSTIGGAIRYTIEVTDGTDFQVETGEVFYSSYNKAGVVSGTITEVNSQQNLSAGTLATTWAISNANPAVISINANSSLTPSAGYPRITFSIENLGQQAIAIQ